MSEVILTVWTSGSEEENYHVRKCQKTCLFEANIFNKYIFKFDCTALSCPFLPNLSCWRWYPKMIDFWCYICSCEESVYTLAHQLELKLYCRLKVAEWSLTFSALVTSCFCNVHPQVSSRWSHRQWFTTAVAWGPTIQCRGAISFSVRVRWCFIPRPTTSLPWK